MGTGRAADRDLNGTVAAERGCLRAVLSDARGRAGIEVTLGGLNTPRGVVLSDFIGTRTTALDGLVVRHGAGLGGQVLATRKPVTVADYAVDAGISHDYNAPVVRDEGLRSAAAVPVIVDNHVAAVLYGATRRPNTLGERTTPALLSAAERLRRDLSLRRRVHRSIRDAERRHGEAMAVGLGGAALEDVREAHAHLRTLTHTVADDALRARLDLVTGLLARAASGPSSARTDVALSPREVDVLSVVAMGCTTAEIAMRLDVSPETVKAHLRSASRKLGTHTRHEAVIEARRLGLLP